jgi:hypothetical protein
LAEITGDVPGYPKGKLVNDESGNVSFPLAIRNIFRRSFTPPV